MIIFFSSSNKLLSLERERYALLLFVIKKYFCFTIQNVQTLVAWKEKCVYDLLNYCNEGCTIIKDIIENVSENWYLFLHIVVMNYMLFNYICDIFPGTSGTTSCLASYLVCNTIFSSIMKIAGNINVRQFFVFASISKFFKYYLT